MGSHCKPAHTTCIDRDTYTGQRLGPAVSTVPITSPCTPSPHASLSAAHCLHFLALSNTRHQHACASRTRWLSKMSHACPWAPLGSFCHRQKTVCNSLAVSQTVDMSWPYLSQKTQFTVLTHVYALGDGKPQLLCSAMVVHTYCTLEHHAEADVGWPTHHHPTACSVKAESLAPAKHSILHPPSLAAASALLHKAHRLVDGRSFTGTREASIHTVCSVHSALSLMRDEGPGRSCGCGCKLQGAASTSRALKEASG